jgi:hypothetical protein
MANTQATKEAIWRTKLMMDLGYMEEKKMMVIRCDNQGAISLTKNPTHHARTKHIDVQHHFVRERVENGEVRLNIVQRNTWWRMSLPRHYQKNQESSLPEIHPGIN